MTIKTGTIGVNTAADDGELLEVIDVTKNLILARPLAGGMQHLFPTANFWPLLAGLPNRVK